MTGRYKVYLENSDSNSEWLGEIPAHWIVSKFAYVKTVLTDYTANGSFADLKKNVAYKDEPSFARLVRLTDLRKDLDNDGVWIDESAYNYLKKSALFGGEFLLANVGAYAGLFYQMPYNKGPASLAPNMFMAKFSQTKILPEFMAYVGQSDPINKQLTLNATASSAQPKLNKDDFKSIKFCYPSLIEQQKIAGFLDHETAKIDTLIAKQEKLIELLKEKRQAVISHAVTKGLNPNAPMRDSGVEWLGEVPKHWVISPSKRLFPESKNRAPTSDMQLSATQDYGVISQKKFMQLAGRKVVQLNSNQELRKKVHVGDFVISMRSFQGGLERAWEEGGIRSSYVVLKPSKTVNKDYFQYLFKSVRYIQAIQSTANFIRDGQDMNYQNFILIDLPLPSLEEQEYIASFLREHINKIDSLVDKAQKAISLMQERKTALISAAVTGKIDVRDFVSEQGQPQGI